MIFSFSQDVTRAADYFGIGELLSFWTSYIKEELTSINCIVFCLKVADMYRLDCNLCQQRVTFMMGAGNSEDTQNRHIRAAPMWEDIISDWVCLNQTTRPRIALAATILNDFVFLNGTKSIIYFVLFYLFIYFVDLISFWTCKSVNLCILCSVELSFFIICFYHLFHFILYLPILVNKRYIYIYIYI